MIRPTAPFLRSGLTATVVRTLLVTLLLGFFQVVIPDPTFFIDKSAALKNTNPSVTYTYDGALKYFVVPDSVYRITVDMRGGTGGKGGSDTWNGGHVGKIGRILATFSVRPGDTVTIAIGSGGVNGDGCVGGAGASYSSRKGLNPIADFNGGEGAVTNTSCSGNGGGGGAATVVIINGKTQIIAPGGGGSGGGNNISYYDTITSSLPYSDSVTTQTSPRAQSNRTDVNGYNGAGGGASTNTTSAGTTVSGDGGQGGGGGGGYRGGKGGDTVKVSNSSELFGFGGSAGTFGLPSDSITLTTSWIEGTLLYGTNATTTNCGTGFTTSGWTTNANYTDGTHGNPNPSVATNNAGCGAPGSVVITYPPTPKLVQKDSTTATVFSTAVGNLYLVRDTATVNSVSDLTTLVSAGKGINVSIATANTGQDVSLSGLPPGRYVGYAVDSDNLLSSASVNTVYVAAGKCGAQTVSAGLSFSVNIIANYCILTFTGGSGTWTVPESVTSLSFLAVGGGAGGSGDIFGGGGGGEIRYDTYSVVTPKASVSIAIGTGGMGGVWSGGNATAGANSTLSGAGLSVTASGGSVSASQTGGLGGTGGSGGAGIAGANGGSAVSSGPTGGASCAFGGVGGTGTSLAFSGSSMTYSDGGGGNIYTAGDVMNAANCAGVIGGSGNGGTGAAHFKGLGTSTGTNGVANTGSGGGAGSAGDDGGISQYNQRVYGGAGGSGVVIVRYIPVEYSPIYNTLTIIRGYVDTYTAYSKPATGYFRTTQWQLSTNSGSTWTTLANTSTTSDTNTYVTPVESTTANGYLYRLLITDTTTPSGSNAASFSGASQTYASLIVSTPPTSSDTDTVLSLSGSNYATTYAAANVSDTFTVELWVKPTLGCAGATNQRILRKTTFLNIDCHDNRFYATGYDSGGTALAPIDFNVIVETSTWQHLGITRNGTTGAVTLYYNGGAMNTGTMASMKDTSSAWTVGGSATIEYFSGQVDEIKVWSTIRTAAEIKTGMHNYTAGNSAGLLIYWDFNELSSSTRAYDRSVISNGTTDLIYKNSVSVVEHRVVDTTTATGVTIIKFLRSYITINSGWIVPQISGSIRVLNVAGGGAGGADRGGGGGAGGRIYTILNSLPTYTKIQVGMGGNGAAGSGTAGSGESSTVGTLVAHGGGAGGASPSSVQNQGKGFSGGSGGGGSFSAAWAQDSGTGNTGGYTPPEGYAGAPSILNGNYRNTGGGGGATGPGISGTLGDSTTVGSTGTRPDGGPGDTLSITGVAVQYSAGGGGARGIGGYTYPSYENMYFSAPPGLGGTGTCGKGANVFQQYGGDGCYNTGGGGGGGATAFTNGAAITAYSGRGGSGIIVLRYITDTPTSTSPVDTSVAEGDTPTFKIVSTPVGSLVRTYRWQYETSTGTTWLNVTDGTGYDTTTYTLPQQNNRARNQYHYRVQIIDSDTVTGETVTSYTESATLTVRAPGDLDADYAATFSTNKEAKSTAPITFSASTISAEIWVNRTTSCSSATDSYAMNFNNVIGFTCRSNEWHGKLYSGSTNNDINFNQAPQLNQWHHLAMTFNNGIWYAYYDGQEVESTTGTFVPAANNYLYVGSGGGTGYFDGQIDEIKIWNSNRRTSISTDLHDAVDTSTSGLFAYYNFNETGTVLHDRDATAMGLSDLIPTGTAWTTQTVDSSSVVGSNRLYQFPRTIINSYGGWSLPKASAFPTAMLVGGGGGGTGNAGYGGAGGGVLKGKVTTTTTSRLKIKVGTGGINSYSYNSAVPTAPIFVGGTGGTTSIISADNTVNAVVTGGVGGPNHWKDNRCQNPTAGTEAANYNASASAGGAPTSTTGITVIKSFTGTGGGLIDPAQGAPSDAAAGTSDSITGTTHIYGGGGGSGGWNIAGSNGGGDNGNAQGGSGNAGGGAGNPGTDAFAFYGGGGGGGGDSCQINGGRGGTGVVYLLYPTSSMEFISPVDTKTSVGQITSFSVSGDPITGYTRSYQWQKQDSGTSTWTTIDGSNFDFIFFDYSTPTLAIGNSFNSIADKSMSGMRFRAKLIDTNNTTFETFSAYTDSATLTIFDQFTLTGGGSAIRTPYGIAASSLAFTSTGGVTPIKWSLVSPPTGITIDSATAIITAGITTQPAQYLLTVKATDAAGAFLTETASVYVGSLPILMVGDVFSWVDTGTSFSLSGKKGKSSFTNVTIDAQGNVYGFGASDSGFAMTGTSPMTFNGYQFVKIDKNGVVQWIKYAKAMTYNVIYGRIWGKKIVVDSSGNVYFAASGSGAVMFDNHWQLFNSIEYPVIGDFIVKMDSAGATTWIARLDNSSGTNQDAVNGTSPRGLYGDVRGLAVDSSGNVYIAGIQTRKIAYASPANIATNIACNDTTTVGFWLSGSCGSARAYEINGRNGYESAYLIKVDAQGNLIWVYNTANSSANVAFASVDVDPYGNLLLTGTVDDSVSFRSLSLSARYRGYGNFFAMKLDSDGNGIWVSQDGGGISGMNSSFPRQGDQAFTGFTDPSGAVYVAGGTFGGTTLNSIEYPFSDGITAKLAAVAIKFDNSGYRLWSKQLTSDSYNDSYWYSGGADQNGNAYLVGRIKDAVTLNGVTYNYTGKINPLIEYSANGSPVYLAAYGGAANTADTIKAIAVDPLGNMAAAGVINDTTTLDSFTFLPKADDDAFIGMLRNNSSGLSASMTAKYGTVSYSPTVVVFGGTAPYTLTLRNTYNGKIIADTSSGVSVIYSNATSLIPGIYADSITVVDALAQTYTLLETLTVTKADTVTVTPTTPVGLVYNNGDTITWNETVSVTPLVNNDTVTTAIYYSGTAFSGETYSATNTVFPKKAGNYVITPLITAVSYGTVSGGQLAYYQYTNYETATLSIGRATRALRIDNAAYSNLYMGAAKETITLYATGVGVDTVTVTWTLVTGSCTMSATGVLYSSVATACVVNISVPQTNNYLAASDTRTINFYIFTSGFNGSNQSAGGSHTIILDFNNYLETTTITTAADSSTTTIAPVITSITQTAGGIGSFSNVVIEIVGANFWTTAGSVTVNFGRNVDNRNATAYITSRTPTKITLSIPDSYMSANGFTTGVSMGRAAVITPAGEAVSNTPALRVIFNNV